MATDSGGAWTTIASSPSGTPAFFLGTTSTFGDFALVAAKGGFGPLEVSLLILVIGAFIGGIGFLILRRRRRLELARAAATGRRRPGGGTNRDRKRKRR